LATPIYLVRLATSDETKQQGRLTSVYATMPRILPCTKCSYHAGVRQCPEGERALIWGAKRMPPVLFGKRHTSILASEMRSFQVQQTWLYQFWIHS
jgi:hypothetical protein